MKLVASKVMILNLLAFYHRSALHEMVFFYTVKTILFYLILVEKMCSTAIESEKCIAAN